MTTRQLIYALPLILVMANMAMAQDSQPASQPASQPTSQPDSRPRAPLPVAQDLASYIEKAHGIEAWNAKDAIQADLELTFGGAPRLKGTMTYEIHSGKTHMALADGVTLVFDGEKAWVSPASAEVSRARFHLLTWPYFLAAPYKLRDPGSHLELSMPPKSLHGKTCATLKLTFDEGVGDTPDDWYLAYADIKTQRLLAMAYIVTYGKAAEEAEKDPHAITYEKFETIDGVTMSTAWRFFNWNEKEGVHGDPLGAATLSNIKFVSPASGLFDKPVDAREDKVPEATDSTG